MFDFFSSKHEPDMRRVDGVDSPPSLKKLPPASDKIITEEMKLETKIFSLYRCAWLGIYQVHDENGRDHATRLAELFVGAGMSSYVDKPEEELNYHNRSDRGRPNTGAESLVLYPLLTALAKKGLKSLKLFNGLPVTSLEAVIELLEAYVKEVTSVNALYQLLRELQVGYRTPTEGDEQAVLEQFIPAANQFARRLLHLDARLKVLVSDMEDDFWSKHGLVEGREGRLVHYVVFPRLSVRAKKMSLGSAMKA